MKKLLLVMFGLMVVVIAACGNKGNEENIIEVDPLENLVGKTSFTAEDLDTLDEYKFPKSYTYSVYTRGGGESTFETGSYVYPDGVSHNLLLPIHENMVNREVVESLVDNGRISTTVSITLDNGESYPIKYMNAPDTLEYVGATLNTPTSTVLYTFEY